MMLVMWTMVLAMAAATILAAHHLSHLPAAPECPACRSITARLLRASRLDRALARWTGADARCCPRCGWHGRMRWRLATERARK
jgi:hypothetical protein